MAEESSGEKIVEKALKEQIIDKMIGKLMDSKTFSDDLLKKLEAIDLSNKNDVKAAISMESEEENENTEAGD